MTNYNSIVFGPVPSRRFGISLGVDLSPNIKQCNFDCLYCELEPAKTVSKMSLYPDVSDIIKAIKDALLKHTNIDVITITCNGEPTLYPQLDILIDEIDKIKGKIKTLILSNGSTIYKEDTFKTLLKIDIVKLSLDCISEKCFKKLDRQNSSVEVEKIVPAMINFSKTTKNIFVLEILFVKDLNDKEEEIELLYQAIKKINPNRVDIGTIDRPPAYKVQGVDFIFLQSVSKKFVDISVNIVYKNRPSSVQFYNEEEIISTLKRRPLTLEDIENMFDKPSKDILEKLISMKKVDIIDRGGVDFYKIN